MALYIKINRTPLSSTGETKWFTEPPSTNLPSNKPIWVPYIETVEDNSTANSETISSVETRVFSDRVERVTVTRDKTQSELDRQDNNSIQAAFEGSSIIRSLVGMIRDLDNRVRVLEGKPPMPLEAFKGLVKSKIRN